MDQEKKSEDVTQGVADDVDNIAEFEATAVKDPLTGHDIKPARPETVEAVFGVGSFEQSSMSEQAMAVEEGFEELVSVRHALDTRTDELNKCIEEFEQRLRDCNPGVEAWVQLEPRSTERKLHVGFTRLRAGEGSSWSLAINDNGNVLQMIRASRYARAQGAKRFPDLLGQIVERSQKILSDVTEVTERLQKIL